MPTIILYEGGVGAHGISTTSSAIDVVVEADNDDGDIVVGDAVTFTTISPSLLAAGMKDAGDNTGFYYGTHVFDGQTGYVFGNQPTYADAIAEAEPAFLVLFLDDPSGAAEGVQVNAFARTPPPSINSDPALACFAKGTFIATPSGETRVEDLAIGDSVLTADGRAVPVKWIGRQTVRTVLGALRCQTVRIRAGALGEGLPHTDLVLTGDHGMILDGVVATAAALVNGSTIDWEPVAELGADFTVYHVETEAHDVILANGALSETFVDFAGRQAFDNFNEYIALYGAERIIPEMPQIRIAAQRLLPEGLRARLGIDQPDFGYDTELSA